MRVGFIGVGVMGSAMAKNILKGGYQLVVFDSRPEAIHVLVEEGATSGDSPMDIASQSDVVITMLPMPQDIEEVVLGNRGIIQGVHKGLIFIDTSTSNPMLAKHIADTLATLEVSAIDCPVGGGESEAITGKLLLIAGGDAEAIERVRPLLMCVGREIIHCGGPGTGQAIKLVNNMLGAITYEATAEALTLGMKFGIRLETILKVLSNTAASNALITRVLPVKVFKGDFQPGFKIRLAQKDIGLAVEMAKQLNAPVPLAALTLQRCSTLIASGYGELDIGAIVKAQGDLLGLDFQTENESP